MAVHLLHPVVPDLKIIRMEPCSALVAPDAGCGATPASLYRRTCGVAEHDREIWLCPVHAALAVSGGAICRECASRLGVVAVKLERLTEPVRLP